MENRLFGILKKWWIVLVLGIASILLGIAALVNPGSGFLAVKIFVLSDYLVISAMAMVMIYVRRYQIPAWGWEMAAAVALFIVGIILVLTPIVSDGLLVVLFAAGFILEGMSGISGAVVLKNLRISGWGYNMLLSVFTVICGIMLIFRPVVAVLSIDLLVAVAMMSFGFSLIIISYRLSKLKGTIAMAERKAGNVLNTVREAGEMLAEQSSSEK